MSKTTTLNKGTVLDSKSKVGRLSREIDGLVRQYVSSGSDDYAVQASKLSREKEDLLKPYLIRSGKIRKAG